MAALSMVAVLILIVVGVVAVVGSRQRGGGIDARGVRRFFQYLVLFILVVVVAIGLAELVGRAFGASPEEWQDPGSLLARALAFVVIGVPVATVLAWWTWRGIRRDPAEADSAVVTLYLSAMLLTSLVMASLAARSLVFQAVGRARFDAGALGEVVAWGLVWVLHWRVARRLLPGERASAHLLLGSLFGLVLGAYGMVATLGSSLDLLLRPGQPVVPATALAQGGALLLVGALVWTLYWPVSSARGPHSPAWLAYVLLAGVGGGLILALTGVSQMLWSVLVWVLGDRLERSAATHFDSTAFEAAMLIVGVLLWWYHRSLVADAASARDEIRRVYEYLISGIGLAAVAAGLGTVVVAFVEALTQGADSGMTTRNTLLAALTLLGVGGPVWWLHWRRILRARAADPVGEVSSPTRRIYLIVSFGVAGLTAVVALLTVGYSLFQDIVAAQIGPATLRSMRYGLGVLLAAAAVSVYHGAVFRQDRGIGAQMSATRPRSVVLVGPADAVLIDSVRRTTGGRAELWERADTDQSTWDRDAVMTALAGAADDDVLVLAEPEGPRILRLGRRMR